MAKIVQRGVRTSDLEAAKRRGYMTQEQLAAIREANLSVVEDPGTDRDRAVKFYSRQSKQISGEEDNKVEVPIWVDRSVHQLWHPHIEWAIGQINLAAPGLNLYETKSASKYKVKIVGTNAMDAYTEGNILCQDSLANITLGHEFEDKQQTSIHELLHSLGFSHEQCRRDAHLYLENKVLPSEDEWFDYAEDPDVEALARFDPFSVMLYPEEKEKLISKHEGDTVWLKKLDRESINKEMSELDKLRLNILYRPCKSDTYNPQLSPYTNLYYCGRAVMADHNRPEKNTTDDNCGPDNWANCPACRTLKNPRVDELVRFGKWQGWSGLFYCGGPNRSGDGYCGPDNGIPCPECFKILFPIRSF